MSDTRIIAGVHWDDDWSLTLEFKLPDFWIGAFWKREEYDFCGQWRRRFDLWVCLLPCLPLHLKVDREAKPPAAERKEDVE